MDPATERRRHSAAHVLAMAVQRLFPQVKLGIGPVTVEGFYHDFEFPTPITWDDVRRIESEMNIIIQEDKPFGQLIVPRDQAFEILMTRGQIYKSELLQAINDEEISFYKTGEEFIDLCRGPHVGGTNEVGAIKLLAVSDTHWKNDPTRPALQRITGVVFATAHELNQFLTRQQAIQSRDFRKYASDLGLTLEIDGHISYTPQGTLALNIIKEKLTGSLEPHGFQQVILPGAALTNGESRYFDEIFSSKNRSYRSLPYKMYATTQRQYQDTTTIAGKGIDSVISITTKNFFSPEQAITEITGTVNMVLGIFHSLNIAPRAHIHASNLELRALQQTAELLHKQGVSQTQVIDASTPDSQMSIGFTTKDSLEREWELVTVTYSMRGPDFVNSGGEFEPGHTLTISTKLETFVAYLLEDMEGALPYWAAPVQALIIPITEHQQVYSEQINKLLLSAGIRSRVDPRNETMQARIRDAELLKTPAVIVVGEKEENVRAVSVRLRNRQELGLVAEDELITTLQSNA